MFTSSRPLARSRPPFRALRHAPAAPRDRRIASAQSIPPQQLVCPLDDDDEDDVDASPSSPSSSSSFSTSSSSSLPLLNRRVIITTPRSYSASLGSRLLARGGKVLSVPGVRTVRLKKGSEEERELDGALKELLPGASSSSSSEASPPFSAVAFTSRAGIEACLERIAVLVNASPSTREGALAAGGAALASAAAARGEGALLFWALGADADALVSAGVPRELIRKPDEASTKGMVNAMASFSTSASSSSTSSSFYFGRRILCPVPTVVGGLTEPPVVPRFLAGLSEVVGAIPVRVPAYATAPAADVVISSGASSASASSSSAAAAADGAMAPSAEVELSLLSAGHVDALVFSSTAEVQGLDLAAGGKLVEMIERGNEERRRRRRRKGGEARGGGGGGEELDSDIVLAAHGPYTAAGATRVLSESNSTKAPEACTTVTVVPEDFSTFAGVVEALEEEFRRRRRRRG